ncbi:MAG: hypothetical protein MJ153_06305 [Clostridia bacterium]|nr:hypothetical protein [Clostridia bacterium]
MTDTSRRIIRKLSVTLLTVSLCACNVPGGMSNYISSEADALGVADAFLDSILEIDKDKMSRLVVEDDRESDFFEEEITVQNNVLSEGILAKTLYEADEDKVKFTDNNTECKVDYKITMPNYEQVYEKYYDDALNIEDAVSNAEKVDFTVKIRLVFENDDWQITDFEDICDEFYKERLFKEGADTVYVEPTEPEPSETDPIKTQPTESDYSEPSETEPTESKPVAETTAVPTVNPSTAETTEYTDKYTLDDVMNADWNDFIFSFDGEIISLPYPYEKLEGKWALPEKYDSVYYLNPGSEVMEELKYRDNDALMIYVYLRNNYDAPIDIRDAVIGSFYYSRLFDEKGKYFDFVLPGGIQYGSTLQEVYDIYGEPNESSEYGEMTMLEYIDNERNMLYIYCKDTVGVYSFEYIVNN